MHRVSGTAVSAEPGRHRLLMRTGWVVTGYLVLEVTRETGRDGGGCWLQHWAIDMKAVDTEASVG